MATRILLVGTATDGPTNVAVSLASRRQLLQAFGGGYLERFSVAPTGTSVTLGYEPLGNPQHTLGDRRNYLYHPELTEKTLSFGVPGGTIDLNLDVTYDPYTGKSDLLYAGLYALEAGVIPYLARLPGGRASLAKDDWVFEARYDGARYNQVKVAWDGTTLTISGMEPNFPRLELQYPEGDLAAAVEHHYQLGTCPIYVRQAAGALPIFTATALTGGGDGAADQTAITEFLNGCGIPHDVSHVAVLGEWSDGLMTEVGKHLAEEQPRVFMMGAPAWTTPASAWLTNAATGIPTRSRMTVGVLGDCVSSANGVEKRRYAVEAAAVALQRDDPFSMTNLALGVTGIDPVLSGAELDVLTQQGWTCPVRTIGKDIALYRGVNTAADGSLLLSAKVAEVVAIATEHCLPYFGALLGDGRQNTIEEGLASKLSTIAYLVLEEVVVDVNGSEMLVSVAGLLPNEILRIDFYVKNG